MLRAAISPHRVFVIPNAISGAQFTPEPSLRDKEFVTIVVLSRLVYRKGIDLLVDVIPRVCAMHKNVRFIIGGDGPKRVELEGMRELNMLHSRVELVGSVMHRDVPNVAGQRRFCGADTYFSTRR